MLTFTSKNYTDKNFDAIRIQRRISASFLIKMSWTYVPKFTSKEKFAGYSVYSYSRIASIERALKQSRERSVRNKTAHRATKLVRKYTEITLINRSRNDGLSGHSVIYSLVVT